MDTPHNWHLLDKTSLNSDMTVSHPSSLPGTERMQNIGATPVIHIKLVEVPKQAKRLPSDSMDFGHTHTHTFVSFCIVSFRYLSCRGRLAEAEVSRLTEDARRDARGAATGGPKTLRTLGRESFRLPRDGAGAQGKRGCEGV